MIATAAAPKELTGFDEELDWAGFRPDPKRAVWIDARVRDSLADSLAALFGVLAEAGEPTPSPAALLARVRSGPVPPRLFGLYTELADAVLEDDLDRARPLAHELLHGQFESAAGFRPITLSRSFLGDGHPDRYCRLLNDDPDVPMALDPLDDDAFASASDRAAAAVELLDRAAPEIAGEIRSLIRELVLVRDGRGPRSTRFHGASTFYLWGALFLNAAAHPDRVALIEGLAHESAHTLLFGFTLGSPLVENTTEERYASPLRQDPRPMDGLVHATYVLARMHYAAARLRESDLLETDEREAVERAIRRTRSDYADGHATVRTHARWTPVGEAVFREAERFMSESA